MLTSELGYILSKHYTRVDSQGVPCIVQQVLQAHPARLVIRLFNERVCYTTLPQVLRGLRVGNPLDLDRLLKELDHRFNSDYHFRASVLRTDLFYDIDLPLEISL